nr:MAG: hypothetical protein [Bacteriophage sp.]
MKTIDVLVEELPRRGGWPDGAIGAGFFSGDGALYFWDKNNDCPLKWTIDTDIEVEDSDEEVTREQYEAALAASKRCDHKWVPSEGRTQSGYLCSKCGNYDGPGYDWIDWPGGECPVPRGTLVDVRYRDSQAYPDRIGTPALVAGGHGATYHHWLHDGMRNDIIAYRLHQPQEAAQSKADDEADLNECIGQDSAPVWNGEGLPPVGCEFEYGLHRTKAKCLAVAHHMIFASKGNPDDEESDYEEFMISILDSEFHRVRTEADRKRDEAVKTIMLTGWCQSAAEEIYDLVAAGKVPGMKLEG